MSRFSDSEVTFISVPPSSKKRKLAEVKETRRYARKKPKPVISLDVGEIQLLTSRLKRQKRKKGFNSIVETILVKNLKVLVKFIREKVKPLKLPGIRRPVVKANYTEWLEKVAAPHLSLNLIMELENKYPIFHIWDELRLFKLLQKNNRMFAVVTEKHLINSFIPVKIQPLSFYEIDVVDYYSDAYGFLIHSVTVEDDMLRFVMKAVDSNGRLEAMKDDRTREWVGKLNFNPTFADFINDYDIVKRCGLAEDCPIGGKVILQRDCDSIATLWLDTIYYSIAVMEIIPTFPKDIVNIVIMYFHECNVERFQTV